MTALNQRNRDYAPRVLGTNVFASCQSQTTQLNLLMTHSLVAPGEGGLLSSRRGEAKYVFVFCRLNIT